jgi:hypothetical protein
MGEIAAKHEPTNMKRDFSHSTSSSEDSTVTQFTIVSQSTVLTEAAEMSEVFPKTPKSVRFEETAPKTTIQSSQEMAEPTERKGRQISLNRQILSKVRETLRELGTRLERALITTLMRLGY